VEKKKMFLQVILKMEKVYLVDAEEPELME